MRNLGAGTGWDFGPQLGKLKSPKYLGSYNREGIQTALKFDAGGDFTATYKFFWFDEDATPEGNGLLDVIPSGLGATTGALVSALFAANPSLVHIGQFERPDAVNNWFSMPQKFNNQGHIFTVRWKATSNLSVKNTFGYLKNSFHNVNEIDAMGGLINNLPENPSTPGRNGLGVVGAPFIYAANTTGGGSRQWSDELQLNYNSRLVTVTAGYLHYDIKVNQVGAPGLKTSYTAATMPDFVVPLPAVLPISKTHTKSDAIYGQAEIHVTPQFDIIGGIRYTWDNKNALTNNANVPPFSVYKDSQV
jgi:iron complex outermembrane receptor protein